jgi:bifunctional UDP-N-acetylglucosamine pyrophosphorylase/glucosamine-1-phosphate N-acetyltransferase
MKSALPKVLHALAGRSLLNHVLQATTELGAARTVVITGHGAEAVEATLAGSDVRFARQMPQLGTGHAVQQALPQLDDANPTTLILNGDVPLIRSATAAALARACDGRQLALLTIELADATGYGRILRDADGSVRGIVEHKDASAGQRAIREIYTGMMAAPTAALKRWLSVLKNDNAQGEYYLTDVVALAVAEGTRVVASAAPDETEVLGVNSPLQLADLERRYQHR